MLIFTINNKLYNNRKEAKKDIGLWRYKCAVKNGKIIFLSNTNTN